MEGTNNMGALPPIFDTHLHLWERAFVDVSWTKSAAHFDRDFTLADYEKEVAGLDIQALYMEVNADEGSQSAEMEFVLKRVKEPSSVLMGGILFLDPRRPDFEAVCRRYAQSPAVVGGRMVMHLPEHPRGMILQQKMIAGLAGLGANRLTFDVCIRAAELKDVVAVAVRCPETVLVLDHAGCINPPFELTSPSGPAWATWLRDLAEVGKQPNVYCKLSGLVSQLPENWGIEQLKPIIGACLSSFPINRLIVGSDWPICTVRASARQWFHALAEVLAGEGLTQEQLYHIFYQNAYQLYHLSK